MDEIQNTQESNLLNLGKIIGVDLKKEMSNSFMDYSMSVIVQRALPDVRDGLKPVHRRILYTMYENTLWPEKAYRKCADTVGSVLGRFHPHGDASVYDALVRLAQDFSMRYMLVDGHGNFGSVDGDSAAAYRYTEARMNKLSVKMLEDIDKDTVDFKPNYDDRLEEPTALPCHFPNLLVNGSTGIAVGMATNIPPHNMGEVIDGVCCLIDNPEATLDELMEHIKGPDFPTGGTIMGRAGIRAAYATGRGKIYLRARAEIEEDEKKGRSKIIVTEIPYQVNKAKLIEHIAELAKDKRIEGIANIEDHSDRNGMYITIDVKRDASPQIVLNKLYAYSQMQVTFGAILIAIVDGQPKTLTLHQILQEYIKFQTEVIIRRTNFDLKKAKDRAHILEGLLKALDFIDEVINILRNSKNIPEGKEALMERFGLDDVQAQAIVQMRFGQLTGLERDKLEDEMGQLEIKIADFMDILESEPRRMAIIKDEATAVKDKFSDERRTEIVAVSGEVDIEDLIPREECVLTMTNFGYVKRQKMDTYQIQKRGGRGVSGMNRRDEDVATEIFVINSHDYVMFFTNLGRVYKVKCYEIPEGSRGSRGMNINNILPLTPDEKITSMIRVSEFDEENFLVMVTKKGIIKRTKLSAYNSTRKGGLIAIDLDEGDLLSWVRITSGSEDIIVATKLGMAIRFSETNVRELSRTARGVRAIKLKKEDDEIVGMSVVRENSYLLTVSETGFGRLSNPDDYRKQNRGGTGLINYHVNKYGMVAAIKTVSMDDDIILISEDGIIIRIEAKSIRICARPSKGVKVMRVTEGSRVVTLARAPHEEDEITDTVEDDGSEIDSDDLIENEEIVDDAPIDEEN